MSIQTKFHLFFRTGVIISMLLMLALSAAIPQPALASGDQAPQNVDNCTRRHTVRRDDTLETIAHSYGVKVNDIINANRLKPPYDLTAGKQLCIPGGPKNGNTPSGTLKGKGAFSVRISKGHIFISASDFSDDITYMVKVRDLEGSAFEALQKIRIKHGQSQSFDVKLPGYFAGASPLEVCLKSMHSNDLTCYTVTNK